MRRLVPILCAVALASACKQQEPAAPKAAASAVAKASTALPDAAAATAAQALVARSVKDENELYRFEFSYPAAVTAIPALSDQLDAELAAKRSELASDAKVARDEARLSEFPYNPYSRSITWQVVTDLPDWLSLSVLNGAYTGGAHPNYWFDSLLWDKVAGKRREPLALFISNRVLSAAIRDDFCRELDRQREKKRGEKVVRSADDFMSQCIDPADYTLILGSSDRTFFNRIGILVPPYEAGPYAEGDYEVTLPVTPAILATVKPEFRTHFAFRPGGKP